MDLILENDTDTLLQFENSSNFSTASVQQYPYYIPPNEGDVPPILFISFGIIIPIIAVAGLIGNITTLAVLWNFKSQTTIFLRALAVTDSGILLCATLLLTPKSLISYLTDQASYGFFKNYLYPRIFTTGNYISLSIQLCNIWITVSVTSERYIAICHPFLVARYITVRKIKGTIFIITCVTFIYNLPYYFQTKAVPCLRNETELFDRQQQDYCLTVEETEFGKTDFFFSFSTVLYAFIYLVIPFFLLATLNCLLLKEVIRIQIRSRNFSIPQSNEISLSFIMITIVIVFLVSQTPALIAQLPIFRRESFNDVVLLSISNLLVVINSSANFIIYSTVAKDFKASLRRAFMSFSQRASINRRSENFTSSVCIAKTTGDNQTDSKERASTSKPEKASCEQEP